MRILYGLDLIGNIGDKRIVPSGIEGVASQWQIILNALNYETERKNLLDLGCGAENETMESVKYRGEYEPWLGRFVYSAEKNHGLKYVGVDCGDLHSEVFSNRRLSLLDDKILTSEFQENYFDIATAFMLFNSPELERAITGRDRPNASLSSGEKLANSLLPQLEKILKPDGVFVWYGGDRNLIMSKPKF